MNHPCPGSGADKPRVLVAFAEALPAPEAVFSLRAAGHPVTLIARTGSRAAITRLSGIAVVHITAPETCIDAASADLLRVLDDADPAAVFYAIDDAALWLANVLPARGNNRPRVAHATGAQATFALDKCEQIARATAAGLAVPETAVIRGRADIAAANWPARPMIIKPAAAIAPHDGRLSKGTTHHAFDADDVAQLANDPTFAPATDAPWLAQPLIHGVGEGIFGFATGDGVIGWSAHRRVRMMNPHGSGSSACAAIAVDPALQEPITRMLHDVGWRGPFMVELLRDDAGTAWFMEVNGRLWGSLALARRQGLEHPAWAVAAAIAAPDRANGAAAAPATPHEPRPLVMRHLGRDLVHLMFVLRGPSTPFHRQRWPGFLRSLAAVFAPARPSAFYNFDPAHPLFFLRDAVATVANALAGAIRRTRGAK